MTSSKPVWQTPDWVTLTQRLLDSYRHWLGHELVDRDGSPTEQARRLFEAPRVVVAHDTRPDPVLNFANARALELWETDLDHLLTLPSRMTAEPMHRDERAQLLERTSRDGYVDDYRGIRISTRGRRFLIEQAIVWNVLDEAGERIGQAATFDSWQPLPDRILPDGM